METTMMDFFFAINGEGHTDLADLRISVMKEFNELNHVRFDNFLSYLSSGKQ